MELNTIAVNEILADKKIIGYINDELLKVITLAPELENKEQYIHNFLNTNFGDVDLTDSFNTKLILIYDEVLPTEILLALHTWFYTKCCNINNIIVVTTHTLGAASWYQQYIQLFGVIGFKLVEAPFMSNRYKSRFISIPVQGNLPIKNLKYYFSYYGGSYGSRERDFLSAILLDVGNGYIDYMSGFTSTAIEFDNYLEQLTNFLDRATVDRLLQVKETATFVKTTQTLNEAFDMQGFQFNIDNQSAGQVIRETLNITPYTIITEKTLRCFLHYQIPIPITGGNSIDNLEELGFKFDRTIIDYSYQYEPVFYKRIQKVCDELKKLSNNYTLANLEDYVSANSKLLCYNYNYIASGKLFENIKEKLIREIND